MGTPVRLSRAAWASFVASRDVQVVASKPSARPRPGPPTAADLERIDRGIPAIQVFDIRLAPKPRMTQSDRWKKRPAVLRYRASCDELRLRGARLPHQYIVIIFRAMPASWSAAQRSAFDGTPCTSKPDISNFLKSVEDALHKQDQHIYDGRGRKLWAQGDRLVILNALFTTDVDSAVAKHQPACPAPRPA